MTPMAPRPVRIGRNRRFAPGRVSEPRPAGAIVLPRPFRRRDVRIIENIFRRVAGLHHDGAVLRQQQHHPHLEHQCGLIGGRPQHVIERADAGQLAAESIEQLDRTHALMGGHGPGPPARGKMRHDDGHDREQHERGDIVRIGDREGIDRRQEEEIVAERGGDGGRKRRQQPVTHRDADDGGQKDEIDVLDSEATAETRWATASAAATASNATA